MARVSQTRTVSQGSGTQALEGVSTGSELQPPKPSFPPPLRAVRSHPFSSSFFMSLEASKSCSKTTEKQRRSKDPSASNCVSEAVWRSERGSEREWMHQHWQPEAPAPEALGAGGRLPPSRAGATRCTGCRVGCVEGKGGKRSFPDPAAAGVRWWAGCSCGDGTCPPPPSAHPQEPWGCHPHAWRS